MFMILLWRLIFLILLMMNLVTFISLKSNFDKLSINVIKFKTNFWRNIDMSGSRYD